MNQPKLIAIAPPAHSEDKQIKPPYKCMCCEDSGLVQSIFLEHFVEGTNATKFICKRDCASGAKYREAYKLGDGERQAFAKKHGGDAIPARVYQAQFDYRLSAEMCESIHFWEKEAWLENVWQTRQEAITQSVENLAARK